MEEAVPERSGSDTWEGDDFEYEIDEPEAEEPQAEGQGPQAAGPVAGEDTSSSQAAGEAPSPTPPAAEAPETSGSVAPVEAAPAPVESPAPSSLRVQESEPEADEDSGRMMPRDLIAPSRIGMAREAEAAAELPVKHADVIAFANQKGGVAKTTTTLNLAVAFAESGYRVLCIDLDPQGNLTMSQGIDPDKVEKSLYDVLVNDMPISEIIVKREIDIAVASIDLAGAEIAMSTKIGRERSLEKALKEVSGDYDFVCIDTPPSLGLLTINALTAATK